MNICFVSNVIYPFVTGGAEKRIHEIGTRLAADGHDVSIYGRHYWDGPKETTHEGMTLRAVSPQRELYTDENGQRSITEALEFAKDVVVPLRRDLDEHEVIVASVFPYFPVLASKLAALGTGTPLVTTWHEVWLDYWTDYLGYLAPFGKNVERLTAKTPHYPVAVSNVTANRLTDIGPSRDRIEVVPNGIDVDRIESTVPVEDGFTVMYAGRLIEDKHVDLLLEAFDRVADTVPDATLGVIGDGPEREHLEQQAQNLEYADRVTMLGFLEDYGDVLAHMRAAEVFVSPSTREGFGITYAEAMAEDCTVIEADHPESAASEVVGDAGFLTAPTVDDLAAVLEQALQGERPNMEPTVRAQQFDWDTVAEQAAQCYRRAIDGNW